NEATGCRERGAVVRKWCAHPVLDLAGKRIGDDDLRFGPREKLDPATQHRPSGAPELVWSHRDFIARRSRRNVEEPGPRTVRRRPVIVATLVRGANSLGAVGQGLILQP